MKYLYIKKNTGTKRGFTVVETLVAIFVLLIVTTGPLSFVQSGLRSSFMARDQIVAFYLAQDALEMIKNKLDNTYFEVIGTSGDYTEWLNGLDDCKPSAVDNTAICTFDTTNASFAPNTCSGECPLYQTIEKEYVISSTGNTPTKYTRDVYVTLIEEDREIQVTVHVKWDSTFFGTKEIFIQENLYNKIPNTTL
jgi:Tfp pilus assembly protein PilV